MLLNYPLNDLNILLWNIIHQMQTFLGPEDRLADNDSFRNNGITQLSARRSFWAIHVTFIHSMHIPRSHRNVVQCFNFVQLYMCM